MKKIVVVLLSVLMLCGCMAVTAGAESEIGAQVPVDEDIFGYTYQYELLGECTCLDEHPDECHCCVFCPNLDISYLTSCAKANNPAGVTGFDGTVCCVECTGIWPCDCGCECCKEYNQNLEDLENNINEYWGEEEQENFVDGFQAILKQIRDAFDKFFDAIFEFLRLDEVLGRTE